MQENRLLAPLLIEEVVASNAKGTGCLQLAWKTADAIAANATLPDKQYHHLLAAQLVRTVLAAPANISQTFRN